MNTQDRYWNLFVEMKTQTYYLYYYAADNEKWDRWLNMIQGIASSTSIGAWALWKNPQVEFVWPIVIGTSQVLHAIRPSFPFKQRQQLLMDLHEQFQTICLDMEDQWHDVADGAMTDDEIHDATMKYRKRIDAAEAKILKRNIIPTRNDVQLIAQQDSAKYFTDNYS